LNRAYPEKSPSGRGAEEIDSRREDREGRSGLDSRDDGRSGGRGRGENIEDSDFGPGNYLFQ